MQRAVGWGLGADDFGQSADTERPDASLRYRAKREQRVIAIAVFKGLAGVLGYYSVAGHSNRCAVPQSEFD